MIPGFEQRGSRDARVLPELTWFEMPESLGEIRRRGRGRAVQLFTEVVGSGQ
jgi:hypothetical protein